MINSKWTAHLKTKDEKAAFEKKVKAAKTVLKRLQEIAQSEYDTSDREMHSRENFLQPAWAEKQAFELGIQKALKSIINITEV